MTAPVSLGPAANRLTGADFVRTLACLGVLAHHLVQRLDPAAAPPVMREAQMVLMMGSFGVGAFFVLSGYLLSRPFWQALDAGTPMPSLRIFAMRRFARIAPGYWTALIVSFVLSITVFGFPLDGDLVTRFAAGFAFVASWHWLTLFPVEANGPLWSISFEVASYAMLPVCLAVLFFGRRFGLKGWPARVAWLGAIALALGLHELVQQTIQIRGYGTGWRFGLVGGAREWMPEFNPFGFFAIFAIGALAGGVQVSMAKWRGAVFDILFLAGLALMAYAVVPSLPRGPTEGWGLLDVPYGFPLFPLGVGLMLAAAPSSVHVGRMTELRFFRFIALISFGIYIWHYLLFEIVRQVLFPSFLYAGITAFGTWLALSIVLTAISLVLGWLSYRYIEAPALRWQRRSEKARSEKLAEPSAA